MTNDSFKLQGRWVLRVTDTGPVRMWEEPQFRIDELQHAIASAVRNQPNMIYSHGFLLLIQVALLGQKVRCTKTRLLWSSEPEPPEKLLAAMDEGFLPFGIVVRIYTRDFTTIYTPCL